MKQLLRKKWFRILARTVVVVTTLLLLAVSIFNWQAARAKERAIAQAKTAGMTLSAGDLMTDMPPDEQNFARHGIFALIEDGLALPEERRSPEQKTAIKSYEALGDEALLRNLNRKRGNIASPVDFSFLPDDGSYGKTAASFLAEYDRRHAAVLDEIRSGMRLRYVRRRALPEDFAGGDGWVTLSEGQGFITSRVQRGLSLRTEAALATGDPAKAAESIEMICRLGELTGSRGFLVSALLDFAGFRTIKDHVKRGMEQERWTAEALDRISTAVARQDVRARMIQGAATEAGMVQVFEAWKHDRKRIAPYLESGVFGGRTSADPRFVARFVAVILPNGIFDRAAADQLDEIRSLLALVQDPAPAASWWKVAEELRRKHEGQNEFSQLMSGASAGASLLEIGSRTLAHRQLILAACAIERHRLTHGAYPESLTELPAEITVDPILGGTLRYERTGDTFRLDTPGPPRPTGDGKPDPRAKDWVW
jgi:hypothetical protein